MSRTASAANPGPSSRAATVRARAEKFDLVSGKAADAIAQQVALACAAPGDARGRIRAIAKQIEDLAKIASFVGWGIEEQRAGKHDILSAAHVLDQESKRFTTEVARLVSALRAG